MPRRAEPVERSKLILIVDDEAPTRRVLRTILEARGYFVMEAGDGLDALDLINGFAEDIDLLLTDFVMPLMNGLELAERVRKLRPKTRVLVMSGYVRACLAGDQEWNFIAKPFRPQELADKVHQVLVE